MDIIMTAIIIMVVSKTVFLKSTSRRAKDIFVMRAIRNVGRAIAKLGGIRSLISFAMSRFASESPKLKLNSLMDS